MSFYVKGNATATYVCELFDGDNTRHVAKTFSVTTDWARVELSFPADTTGAFGDDVNASLYLQIWLHAGATFKDPSGTLPATWASKTNGNRAVGGDSFFSSTDRTFFITGVQLEIGQNPTSFEHEPFETTFRKCQRYCETKNDTADGSYILIGYQSDGSNFRQAWEFQVTKRADPTLSLATGASWESASGYSAPTEYSGATHVEYYHTENFYCKQSTNNAPNLVAVSEL